MTCISRKSLGTPTPSFERFALSSEKSFFDKSVFDQSFSPPLDNDAAIDFPSLGYQRARRPALIPPNSSLTLAEAEELVGNRINQPLFPPPDPNILTRLNTQPLPRPGNSIRPPPPHSEPEPQPCLERPVFDEEHINTAARAFQSTASTVSDTRRRALWMKARAHYARDRKIQSQTAHTHSTDPVPPKRKHSAFLLDEEMKCHREDIVGTPHLSEMVPGDDAADEMDVEELQMGEPAVMNIPEGKVVEAKRQSYTTHWSERCEGA